MSHFVNLLNILLGNMELGIWWNIMSESQKIVPI